MSAAPVWAPEWSGSGLVVRCTGRDETDDNGVATASLFGFTAAAAFLLVCAVWWTLRGSQSAFICGGLCVGFPLDCGM